MNPANLTAGSSYELISPTAKLAVYFRGFYDEGARKIAEVVGAEEVAQGMLREKGLTIEDAMLIVPLLEIRYKCIDSQIARLGYKNVLELGVGVAPQRANPSVNYVETDLPGMVEERRRLTSQLGWNRERHYLESANALLQEDIKRAAQHFSGDPFTLVHEGIFIYLSREEQATMAQNIYNMLSQHGGAWVNTDIFTRDKLLLASQFFHKLNEIMAIILGVTERSIRDNAFENSADADDFFMKQGFDVERHPKFDGTYQLGSEQITEVDPTIIQLMKAAEVLVMKPKAS